MKRQRKRVRRRDRKAIMIVIAIKREYEIF